MKNNKQIYSSRGSVALNMVLICVLVIIALVIYKLSTISRNEMQRASVYEAEIVSPSDVSAQPNRVGFSDGLINPTKSTDFEPDEFGAGITNVSVFERDLNADGRNDRITRTHVATGTAHDYDKYQIELNVGDGKYVDITPDDFRTVRGADCALAKLQFGFAPNFRVVKIARPLADSWITPSPATRTTYALSNGKMVPVDTRDAGTVCDVSRLF